MGGRADSADPAVVLIVMESKTEGWTSCTGVAVSPHVIVTAAHCLDPRTAGADAKPYYVFLGEDLGSKEQLAVRTNFVHVAETHVDPAFSPASKAHDIGVVVTATALPMKPARINRQPLGKDTVGSSVRVVGYGISTMGPDAGMDEDAGLDTSRHDAQVAITDVDDEHLSYDDPSHALCEGDSGGPSFAKRDDGTEVVVGIHSYGTLLCTGVGADTRIDVYASYVDDFIGKLDPDFPLDSSPNDADGGVETDAGSAPSGDAVAPASASSCTLAPGPTTSGRLQALAVALALLALRRRLSTDDRSARRRAADRPRAH